MRIDVIISKLTSEEGEVEDCGNQMLELLKTAFPGSEIYIRQVEGLEQHGLYRESQTWHQQLKK